MSKRKKLGAFLIVLPFILFIIVILIQIPVRLTAGSRALPGYCNQPGTLEVNAECDSLESKGSLLVVIANLTTILLVFIALLGMVPSIVAGVILILSEKKADGSSSVVLSNLTLGAIPIEPPDDLKEQPKN